jgi:YbbR domain-containing protein
MDRLVEFLKIIKDYSKDYVLENTGLKVLALLITGVLWLSVASRPASRITVRDVPVELRNLDESPKLTVSKYDTLSAQVYLTGPVDVLGAISSSEITLYADLEGVEAGVRVIPLRLDQSRLPASVKEEGIEPRSIRITVEPEVEREVQVKPRFDGEPPEGYEIISQQIIPPTIRIVGAASHVRDITEVSTETVSLTDRREAFGQKVAIDIGSPNVNISSKDQTKVQLTVNISEIRKERAFDRLPVALIGAPQSAQPQNRFVKITVFGPRSAIDALKIEDIRIEIDCAEGRPASVAPRVFLPDEYSGHIEVRSVEPSMIRIRY